MSTKCLLPLISLCLILAGTTGCRSLNPWAAPPVWQAEQLTAIEGFDIPECALVVPERDAVFVANVSANPDEFWSDDNKGFVSLLNNKGDVASFRWVKSTPQLPLHGPKGMCVLGDHLYFTDNTRVMRCSVETGEGLELFAEGFGKANDLATDGNRVWVSDTTENAFIAITLDGTKTRFTAPQGINGITFSEGRMFGVSWHLHEVFELDPTGKQPPQPFGLASEFVNLDGIVVLPDGTFIVSDFKGHRIATITPDRKTVRTLCELDSPADISIDPDKGILYAPEFHQNRVRVYRLKKR
ncbi:MAG: hypothetical protein HN742_16920 [Lentisphaerae bacterium]|jgi:sugar lactone lactonase YvrE|nr:hypothetical protein [Lentisphaerota bacterium]MBT4823134.1 hypothetical protein [Lentisphaerota bacterium]MBT5610478.1 hypothetical protein [Lentisphaerota bacterium]MBT7061069.1 hypothetical protein [Lentisphaerota bacterium]MBT7843564.1 hypothetical protein [Lentisphaerota bacterium]